MHLLFDRAAIIFIRFYPDATPHLCTGISNDTLFLKQSQKNRQV